MSIITRVEDNGLYDSGPLWRPPAPPLPGEAPGRVIRSAAGESRHEISGDLSTDCGFVVDVHEHEPETAYGSHHQRLTPLRGPKAGCVSTAAAWETTGGSR